jgi:parvulin-like peptidyl-prolyl isomerase
MQRIHFLRAVAVVSLAVLAMLPAGCKPAQSAGAVGPLASNTVIAVVNGKDVVAGQIETILQQEVAQRQQMGVALTPAQLDQERRRLMEQRIMDALVRDVLATSDIVVSEVQVDRQIASLVSNEYNGEEQLREALEESNMTIEQFREGLRMQLKVMALVQRDMSFATSTVAEAQEYYGSHRDDFSYPEQAVVSHIQLTVPPTAADAITNQTLERLRGIRAEIKKGTPFAAAAKKYSQCPSAARGGMLGVMDRNQAELPEAFLDAVFAAPLSNVTDTVATEQGYHLLYVTDKKPARTASFDEVKIEIMQGIDLGRRQQLLQQWAQKLRENATVNYKK